MSSSNAAERFLAIARIVRPQGRRGEVAAEILTDFPSRFSGVTRVYLEAPGQVPGPIALENAWPHKGRIILKLAGIDSIDQASRLRGLHVLIPSDEKTALPPHHYYHGDLQGCRVVVESEGGKTEVGRVTEIEPTGGTDLLHVATPRGEILIPLAQEICRRIDCSAKEIVIDPPADLLDLNCKL
jgi:16S rRNA processing protein RimM